MQTSSPLPDGTPLVLYDAATHEVIGARERAHLTPQESRVLAALIEAQDRILPRDRLVAAMVGDAPDGGGLTADRQLSVVVCRIRRKMERLRARASIRGAYGAGYVLQTLVS